MKNANATHAMVRRDGPITSIMAAQVAARRKMLVRERVETFARFRPHGFTDYELFEFARDLAVALGEPVPPESTARKRRTELCEERRIIASEETRLNDHDSPVTVYFHRDHILNPPPLKAQERKPSKFEALQNEIARLKAGIEEARDAERAAVVFYIRDQAPSLPSMKRLANCIEIGMHRK